MYLWLILVLWAVICDVIYPKQLRRGHKSSIKTYKVSFGQMLFTILPLITLIGLRDMGADTETYRKVFDNYSTGLDAILNVINGKSKGPGFDIFSILIKTYISEDYHGYLFIIALISGLAVGYALWKYSEYFLLSYILFILSGSYAWMINGIRQFMAVSIGFAAMGLLTKGKYIKYLCIVLLLCTIHISAIVLIPAAFAVTGRPWNKRTLMLLGVCLVIMLYTSRFVNMIEAITESTSYEGITDSFANDDGVNPLRVLVSAVPVFISYHGRYVLKHISTPEINVCINMSILGMAINMVGMVTSGIIIGRIPIFFTMYGLICIPWMIRKIMGEYKDTVTALMLICYFIFFYLQGRMYYSSDIFNVFIRA